MEQHPTGRAAGYRDVRTLLERKPQTHEHRLDAHWLALKVCKLGDGELCQSHVECVEQTTARPLSIRDGLDGSDLTSSPIPFTPLAHRRIFLHPIKQLLIGPYMMDPSVLIALSKDVQWKGKVELLFSDLDYNDKQNQAATLK